MKTIIAGSREFNNLNMVIEKMKEHIITLVISGHARGADMLGEIAANRLGIPVQMFPADWQTYGKRAGYLRNEVMAEHADALIAFWDGRSSGTKHMIDIAKRKGLQVTIYKY